MKESDVKRLMAKSMHDHSGYHRRFEDQYAVGLFDMLLVPKGLPAFAAEVKIIRDGRVFGPTPRQYLELCRLQDLSSPHIIPVVIGWRDGIYYFHPPQMRIRCEDSFSVTTTQPSFHDQLVMYYHSTRGQPCNPTQTLSQ